jgi:hypothetical protein
VIVLISYEYGRIFRVYYGQALRILDFLGLIADHLEIKPNVGEYAKTNG